MIGLVDEIRREFLALGIDLDKYPFATMEAELGLSYPFDPDSAEGAWMASQRHCCISYGGDPSGYLGALERIREIRRANGLDCGNAVQQ